jgi:hypothetical protein
VLEYICPAIWRTTAAGAREEVEPVAKEPLCSQALHADEARHPAIGGVLALKLRALPQLETHFPLHPQHGLQVVLTELSFTVSSQLALERFHLDIYHILVEISSALPGSIQL